MFNTVRFAKRRAQQTFICTPHQPFIDQTQSVILPQSYLASVFGGPVAVREQDGQLIPEVSIYRVLLALDDDKLRPEQVYRGEAQVQGERESLLYSAYRAVASVFVRESGF